MSSDVETLMEMGFPKNRAEKALFKTQYKGVQNAMDWLFSHGDDPDIDDPFEAPKGQVLGAKSDDPPTQESGSEEKEASSEAGASSPSADSAEGAVAKSLKCDDCGKLLKSAEHAELHAARSGHANFSESTEEIRPLTEEEKQKQLERIQDRIKQKRMEKQELEKQEQIAREKMRRATGKEMSNIKQKMEEDEIKKIVEQRKREKEEERKARQRVKEQIERDKKDRAAKFAKTSPSASSSAPATQQGAPPVVAAPQEKKEYNQARIQIRLTNGQALTQSFGAKEPLSAVRLYTQMNRSDGDGGFTFMTTFPRKVFSDIDMDAPLDSLGLVPSAVLIVTKSP